MSLRRYYARAGADRGRRMLNARPASEVDRQWFRIEAKADSADVFVYDEIGYWGTSAADFAQQLAALDVKTINLRINSPGGEVFDGIAIHNALMNHPAKVNVSVDGLAASIASVICMAGDSITMQQGAQMMIHDASGFAFGNAADMRALADVLDQLSDTIAGFYAERAGGTVTSWRDTMRAETWYTADEAVKAGLADTATHRAPAENSAVPRHSWDLRNVWGYRYADRSEAPEPTIKPVDAAPQPAPELPSSAEILDLGADWLAGVTQSLTDAAAPLGGAELPSSADWLSAIQMGTNTVPEPDASPRQEGTTALPTDAFPALDLSDLRASVREGHL
jgi:ATP-dependent protease ClpP protease subunit